MARCLPRLKRYTHAKLPNGALARLQAYPDVKTEWEKPHSLSALPFIPISFVNKGKVLNFFSIRENRTPL